MTSGTVYEATAYAVPFLIELLMVPTLGDKQEILGLLRAIAGGSSYLDVHQNIERYRSKRGTVEFQAKLAQELQWVHAAHTAVASGIPVYLKLFQDSSIAVRTMLAHQLASFIERRDEIEAVLYRQVHQEMEPVVKASILLALSEMNREADRSAQVRALDLFDVFQRSVELPLVRFAAALGSVILGGETSFSVSLPVLRETLVTCDDYSQLSEAVENFGHTPAHAVSLALASYPQTHLRWLLEMLENNDADIRRTAIYESEKLCRKYRFAAQEVILPLARMVADNEARVREAAAQALPNLGSMRFRAVPTLVALQEHATPDIRDLASNTLISVQTVRDSFDLKHWLRKPQHYRSVPECIAILEGAGKFPVCGEAATTLEFIGPSAKDAVPALHNALNHDSHWVRVRAARALFKITGDSHPSLLILQEELRCCPAGLLVLDCLGEMGRDAESALPTLQQIVDSEIRLVEVGTTTEWIEEDEAFCEAAKRAMDRIRRAP